MNRLVIAAIVAIGASVAPARGDAIRHPSGFTFKLPDIGKSWEQEPRDNLYIVNDASDTLPELQVYVFPATKEGTMDQLRAALHDEVLLAGFRPAGEPVKSFTVGDTRVERIADAQVLFGKATINGSKACVAVVQRGGHTVILVGIPKDGVFERGASNFRAIVQGLEPAGAAAAAEALPHLPDAIGVREVTASSTFKDKRDLYAAWRTLVFEQVDDKSRRVPRTAWCEGKPDEGVGETITIKLAQPTRLDQIRIAAGVWLNQTLFDGNNRITALDVSLDGKSTTVKPGKREWATVDVGAAVSTIAIRVAAVDKGKMNDSCISAVELVRGGAALTPLLGVDGAAADELPKTLAKLQHALAAQGHAGLDALIELPFADNDSGAVVERGQAKRVTHARWQDVVAACKAQDKSVDKVDFRGCPRPIAVDAKDDRPATLDGSKPGVVELVFPSHNEYQDVWRLHWRGGAWRLQAIDYHGP